MDKVNTYTSTGNKLLRQGCLLESWNKGIPIPQSLQVAPTEYCSLRCSFCSVANRKNKHVFKYENLIEATANFIKLGVKTVEITGGGDPLCYPKLNQYIKWLASQGMKIGMITNSVGLNRVLTADSLDVLSWLRISANVLDYKDKIEIPKNFKGTLGFSYVWADEQDHLPQLKRIRDIAINNNVAYVRLVPNCLATIEQQKKNNLFLADVAKAISPPVFFQKKEFKSPSNCYWGYVKPFLYCDEYVYPCSSTVLNPDADKQFNSSYRWCHYTDVLSVWTRKIQSIVDTTRCSHCVFHDQNMMLDYALNERLHEEFV